MGQYAALTRTCLCSGTPLGKIDLWISRATEASLSTKSKRRSFALISGVTESSRPADSVHRVLTSVLRGSRTAIPIPPSPPEWVTSPTAAFLIAFTDSLFSSSRRVPVEEVSEALHQRTDSDL